MQNVLAKIDLNAIKRNASIFKNRTGTRLCAVVKANAYGHGAEAVVCALSEIADFFAVATAEEGAAVSVAACGKEVLVLTPPADEAEAFALAYEGLSGALSRIEDVDLFERAAKKTGKSTRVHLKVNTGMNRYGQEIDELEQTCKRLRRSKGAQVVGLFSHLYLTDAKKAEEQRLRFERAREICLRYFPDAICHLSATYGATLGKEFYYDAVRIGLGLYGYLPTEGLDLPLRKAMKIYARVQETREYVDGGAGYAELTGEEKERAKKEGVSVLRVGYADGFLRSKRVKSVSNEQLNDLCMDACVVRGRMKRGEYLEIMSDASELARRADTLPYEALCACTKRAEFCYE